MRKKLTLAIALIFVASIAFAALTAVRGTMPSQQTPMTPGNMTPPPQSTTTQATANEFAKLLPGVTLAGVIGGNISSVSASSIVVQSDAAGPNQLHPYTVDINAATKIGAQELANSTTSPAITVKNVSIDALKVGMRVVVTPLAEIKSDTKSFVAAKILIIALPKDSAPATQ